MICNKRIRIGSSGGVENFLRKFEKNT